MTPPAGPLNLREMDRQEVRRIAEEVGLGRVAEAIESQAVTSLRFDLQQQEFVAPGRTRFGGVPDLPLGTEWPRWNEVPLIFIGQIALSDLGGTSVQGELPEAGVVSFFYGGSEKAWGFDPAERGASRVLYFAPDQRLERVTEPDGIPQDGPLAPCAWQPRDELTVPPWESSLVETWALSKQEREAYFTVADKVVDPEQEPINRLLGHPDPVQGDMQLECQLVTNGVYMGGGLDDPRADALRPGAVDWRLLLQIDSDEALGSMWGDVGRVYFWIRDADLRAGRFDASWHVMQCA